MILDPGAEDNPNLGGLPLRETGSEAVSRDEGRSHQH